MSKPNAFTDLQRARGYVLAGALTVGLLLLVLANLHHHFDILQGVEGTASREEGADIGQFNSAIRAIQGPANVAVGAVGGLGVAAGSALVAIGSPKGLKTVGASAGAIAALLLGNGIIK